MNRFVWIVGILLLVASLVGANWAFNTPATDQGSDSAKGSAPTPALVIALGYIDGDPGVTRLYPVQSGRVVEVVKEGTQARKGDPLPRVDDEYLRRNLDEAEAERDSAQAQPERGKALPAKPEPQVA